MQEITSQDDNSLSSDDEPLVNKLRRKRDESPDVDFILVRTIILMPIMKVGFADYVPGHMVKKCPTYQDLNSGKKTQYCSLCNEYFNRAPGHPRNMHNHILAEHALDNLDGSYTCRVCAKSCPSQTMMRRHFNQTHRMFEKPKICHICGEELLFYGTYSLHYRNHKESEEREKSFECRQCNVQFTTNAAYHCHKKSFHTDTRVQCDECSKMFRNIQQLRVHKVQAHMEKRFRCEFCDWRCSYKYMIKDHMKKRHSEHYSSMDFSDIKRGRQSKDKLAKALMAGTMQVNGKIEPGLQGLHLIKGSVVSME